MFVKIVKVGLLCLCGMAVLAQGAPAVNESIRDACLKGFFYPPNYLKEVVDAKMFAELEKIYADKSKTLYDKEVASDAILRKDSEVLSKLYPLRSDGAIWKKVREIMLNTANIDKQHKKIACLCRKYPDFLANLAPSAGLSHDLMPEGIAEIKRIMSNPKLSRKEFLEKKCEIYGMYRKKKSGTKKCKNTKRVGSQ